MWAGSLCTGGHSSRPAGAADSPGLLANDRALQLPREGVEKRDLISRGWRRVSRISSSGLPLHPEAVPCLRPPRRSQFLLGCRHGASVACRAGGASPLCLRGRPRRRRGNMRAGFERAPAEGGEEEGRKRLPEAAPLPSQPGKTQGTAGQSPGNGATKASGQRGRNHGNPVLSACQEKILNL